MKSVTRDETMKENELLKGEIIKPLLTAALALTVFALVLLTMLMILSPLAKAQDSNAYSSGYRMGLLTKFSYKGVLFKSWEGEVLLGSNSSQLEGLNPWRFSVGAEDASIVEKLKQLTGQYVVIKYRSDIANPTISSAYRVTDARKVDNAVMPATCITGATATGGYSSGDRIGRLVKISYKGMSSKSWEVIVQLGNSGNEFQKMSVLDDSMARCMVQFMLSGRRAKVTYSQAFINNPLIRDTGYQILRVEAMTAGLGN